METKKLIYVADDHELVSKGLSLLLLEIDIVCEVITFKNGKELFQQCMSQRPHLIFLDYEMPVWNGKKTLIELKNSFPKIPVLMLSMINEKSVIQDCVLNGASGFLNKDSTKEELKEAIETVSMENIYYSKEVLKALSSQAKKEQTDFILKGQISERELEILRMICDGLSPREIAEKCFLSIRTIETHKNNIMQKFDVNSVAKLISISIKNKIV